MKKSKILTLVPQNLVIDHSKNLCHHIKHNLFYLWVYMEKIEQMLLILLNLFLTKLHNGTRFLSHLLGHLKTCFKHPNHKKSPPFQSRST
jgi:hypothetical protein